MRISYNKSWKLLIDKGMNRNDLEDASGVSAASIAKNKKRWQHNNKCSSQDLRST